MKYQDRAEALTTVDDWSGGGSHGAMRLAAANINPATGFASDYLNHFNEAIMLLDMLSACPDCIGDFLNWRPKSYREHFAASRFKDRQMAIAAYDAADPVARHCLDMLTDTMTALLEAARTAMDGGLPSNAAIPLAERTAASLKPLIARAGAVINGDTDANIAEPNAPQAAIDDLFKR
jgi:hypothetical protein